MIRSIHILLIALLMLGCNTPDLYRPEHPCKVAVVQRVIDGDTFVLTTGGRIRLIGIDTPETVHPTKHIQEGGLEASKWLKQALPSGQRVVLKIYGKDVYGRYLATANRCISRDSLEYKSLNYTIVRMGLGRVEMLRASDPNYYEAEIAAKSEHLGIWRNTN